MHGRQTGLLFPISYSLFPVLLRFLVRLVLAAAVTELLELQATRGRLLVLRRRVIPLLALSALQRHNFPHFKILSEIRSQRSEISIFFPARLLESTNASCTADLYSLFPVPYSLFPVTS
jgi:hypothetical protein